MDDLSERVLITIEELLKERPAADRHVDTAIVLQRMRLGAEGHDEAAQAMSALLNDGYVRGKELRGDNKVMDVTVTAITEKGSEYLGYES